MQDIKCAALVPELTCADFARSLDFYVTVLGFDIAFDRPENHFAFLTMGQAQLMLVQDNGNWFTAELEPPYGRGINIQITIDDVHGLANRLAERQVTLFRPMTESRYRVGDSERVIHEFLVQDPDGYLLRFGQLMSA